MKNFSRDLKQHATKIINYEKREMMLNKENKSYCKQKTRHTCKNKFNTGDKK